MDHCLYFLNENSMSIRKHQFLHSLCLWMWEREREGGGGERERESRTSRSGFDNWTFSTAWSRISRAFSTFPETFQQRFCDSEPKEDKYINFNDDSNHEELEAKKDVSMLSSPNNTGDQVKVLNDSPHTCTNSAFFSYWKAFHKGSEECVHMNK